MEVHALMQTFIPLENAGICVIQTVTATIMVIAAQVFPADIPAQENHAGMMAAEEAAEHAQQDGAVMETARLIMGDVLLDLVFNL